MLSFNATKAAEAAKYSLATARQQASRLLTSVDIQAAIRHLLAECMSSEEIAARWSRVATANLDDFYTREKVEYRPRIEKRLSVLVEESRGQMEFEQALAIRSEEFIPKEKDRVKFRKAEQRKQQQRELRLLRLEMELESEPDAVRIVDGPAEWKWEMRLDLAKAEALGLLDLVQSITTGARGTSLSLRDQDAALGNLAKWRGMLTTKVDVTTGGESLNQDPATLAKALTPEMLVALRAAHDALKTE